MSKIRYKKFYHSKLTEVTVRKILEEFIEELPIPKVYYKDKEIGYVDGFQVTEINLEDWLTNVHYPEKPSIFYVIDLRPLKLKIGKNTLQNMSEKKLNKNIQDLVEGSYIKLDSNQNLINITVSCKIEPKLEYTSEAKEKIEKNIEKIIREIIYSINDKVFLLTKAVNLLTLRKEIKCIEPTEEEIEKAIKKIKEKIELKEIIRKMKRWKKEATSKLKILQKIKGISGRRGKLTIRKGIDYFEEAYEKFYQEGPQVALEYLEKALELNPSFKNHNRYWRARGYVLLALGNYEEALECFDEAIMLEKEYESTILNTFYGKAIALLMLGKNKEALKILEQLVKVGTDSIFGTYKQTLLKCYDIILNQEPDNKEIQEKRRKLLKTISYKCPKCKKQETEAVEIKEKPEKYEITMQCNNCGNTWTTLRTKKHEL